MKITRQQLRRIIERVGGGRRYSDLTPAHPRKGLGKNIADAEFPIVVGYDLNGRAQSEIAYNQDELDDILDMITRGPGSRANISYSLDSLADMEPDEAPVGSSIERYAESFTKNKMRRLVRRIVSESYSPDEVRRYLTGQARNYYLDKALVSDGPTAIKMLLQDDFMDNIGHAVDIKDYEPLIDELSHGRF